MYHSPLFVENIFCKCFIRCSMTIEYLKCNFRVKNIFPKVPSRGVKVKNIEISKCSKVCLVGTLNLCLEMPDSMKKVWAQSDHPVQRKRPKCAKILVISTHLLKRQICNFGKWLEISNIVKHFGHFLCTGWSDWAQTFSIKSGISRHKFRVPTRHTLEHFEISIFLTLTPLEGTLGKIFLIRKLHFRYSIR